MIFNSVVNNIIMLTIDIRLYMKWKILQKCICEHFDFYHIDIGASKMDVAYLSLFIMHPKYLCDIKVKKV